MDLQPCLPTFFIFRHTGRILTETQRTEETQKKQSWSNHSSFQQSWSVYVDWCTHWTCTVSIMNNLSYFELFSFRFFFKKNCWNHFRGLVLPGISHIVLFLWTRMYIGLLWWSRMVLLPVTVLPDVNPIVYLQENNVGGLCVVVLIQFHLMVLPSLTGWFETRGQEEEYPQQTSTGSVLRGVWRIWRMETNTSVGGWICLVYL
jgi:hypothetical protein